MAVDEFSYPYRVGMEDGLSREEKCSPWPEDQDKDAFDSYAAGYAWGIQHEPWCGFYDVNEVSEGGLL